uniref:Defective in cullin neddylation protein n=1 Tax=Graphocephala atropunctata TaxID=36148 RepID=A0A1B6KV69_9HEMI
MGNCFSRGKGRPPPPPLAAQKLKEGTPTVQKHTQEINWEMCSEQRELQRNGNSVLSEPLVREKSVRTFCARVGRTSSEAKIGKAVSETRLNTLFDTYRDSTEDNILADGIERLCADLNLSPDEFRVLILAWRLDASQMCRFTREEFVKGCRAMHVDTIKGIQTKLPELETEVLENGESFKDLYRFTFRFGLDVSVGQRILASDMAIDLWRLVFSGQEPPILNRWLRFLESHPHARGIPRDTWNMFLNFAEAVGNDLSTYDDTEAWPSIFDDFVEFENDQANQNITKEREEVIKLSQWSS